MKHYEVTVICEWCEFEFQALALNAKDAVKQAIEYAKQDHMRGKVIRCYSEIVEPEILTE